MMNETEQRTVASNSLSAVRSRLWNSIPRTEGAARGQPDSEQGIDYGGPIALPLPLPTAHSGPSSKGKEEGQPALSPNQCPTAKFEKEEGTIHIPKMAICIPSGNGGSIAFPLTACLAAGGETDMDKPPCQVFNSHNP